ncbi:lung seven transmembrane receptor-domain-containing protein [Cladochytrium replicatum]|nr:lung seven transmembrane receptor-domain-containing protein [Cladochytrium replicatum]
MYTRNDIAFARDDGKITLTFKYVVSAPLDVAVVIYNFLDQGALADSQTKRYSLCGSAAEGRASCAPEDEGKFWTNKSVTLRSQILNTVRRFGSNVTNADLAIKTTYIVEETGFYCAIVYPLKGPMASEYLASLTYSNPYGLLSATDYPNMPFYGFLSITYLIIGVVWLWKCFLSWRDLLALQNYCTGVIFFLMLEMAFNYGYLENYNLEGHGFILFAARNSISFFMLLIVALGYGVVRPTLGGTMKKCLILAGAHFVFAVMYAGCAMVISDLQNIVVFLFVLPVAITTTVFYFWILTALDQTMRKLEARRQGVKLQMYRSKLQSYICVSFNVNVTGGLCFLYIVANTLNLMNLQNESWIPIAWRFQWVFLNGWMNVLYLMVGLGILLLWRPTENNQRYGLDQLATEDHYDDDVEANGGNGAGQQIKLRTVNKDISTTHLQADSDDEDDDEDVMMWAEQNLPSDDVRIGTAGASSTGGGARSSAESELEPAAEMLH